MLWIVITSPSFTDGEDFFIRRLLSHGADLVHLRKPGASEAACAALLESLTAQERSRIVIHDFFELAVPYGLYGIHLNSRRNTIPQGYTGNVSRSCHSLEEVRLWKPQCSHVFLSPVFDSVSKQGYRSAFGEETLAKAAAEGIIDGKVIALGGVTPERIDRLRATGFGGAAMLGHISALAGLPEQLQSERLKEIDVLFHPDTSTAYRR